MTRIIAASFEDRRTAEAARKHLLRAGFALSRVSDATPGDVSPRLPVRALEESAWQRFLRSLTGTHDEGARPREHATRGMSTVAVVTADGEGTKQAHAILAGYLPARADQSIGLPGTRVLSLR